MSARPPATRDVLELPGGLFRLRQIAPPFEGSATKANPAKAGDAKPRGYRTPFACHASRAAEALRRGFMHPRTTLPWALAGLAVLAACELPTRPPTTQNP